MNKITLRTIIFKAIIFALITIEVFPLAAFSVEGTGDSHAGIAQANTDSVAAPPPTRAFSLAYCFSKADKENKDIVVAKRNINIARDGIKVAGAIPNPNIEVQIGFGPAFTQLYTGQTQQIFFTQEIQTAGKRSKKVALARAYTGLTELQLASLRFDVHNRVRKAYAELAAAEAYEDLVEAQRDVAQKLVTIAWKRFNAGKAPKAELLQADLNVLQFDTQRNQAQLRLQQATAALSLIIGEKPEHIEVIDVDDNGLFQLSSVKTEIVPSPASPLCPLDKLFLLALASRLDLKTAQQQVFVNQKALLLAKAQKMPNIFIGGGFSFSTFSQHQPPGLVAQPNWLGQGAFLNLSAENPIFYQHQGEIEQAFANLRNAEKESDLLKLQINTDIVVAYYSVKATRKNISIFQSELLPTASQLAQIARRGYEAGGIDLASAILAQQQYQQTLTNYFDAIVSYQSAWADLEKAVGSELHFE